MNEEGYKYITVYLKKVHNDYEVREENESYTIKSPNNMHDKLFRDLLGDKKELASFLKLYLNIDLNQEELEKYNSSFITKNYENREADVVYKLKDKRVYLLIEHQSRTDNSMPFRLLNYNTEIIRDTNDLDCYKRYDYTYAKVIPIVVYTGSKKWNVSKKFSKQQEQYGNKNYLELEYNLIDINDYNKEKLLMGDTMIEKAMLIEKSKNEKELVEIIEDIVGTINYDDEVQIKKLKRMMQYALVNKIGEDNVKEFIEQINSKSEKEGLNMLWDRLDAERMQWKKEAEAEGRKKGIREGKEEGRKEGIKESIKTTICKMLELGEEDEKIQLYTGATQKQIEQARKTLQQSI